MPSRHRPVPDRFRARAEDTQRSAAEQMPLHVERVVDRSVRLKVDKCRARLKIALMTFTPCFRILR